MSSKELVQAEILIYCINVPGAGTASGMNRFITLCVMSDFLNTMISVNILSLIKPFWNKNFPYAYAEVIHKQDGLRPSISIAETKNTRIDFTFKNKILFLWRVSQSQFSQNV